MWWAWWDDRPTPTPQPSNESNFTQTRQSSHAHHHAAFALAPPSFLCTYHPSRGLHWPAPSTALTFHGPISLESRWPGAVNPARVSSQAAWIRSRGRAPPQPGLGAGMIIRCSNAQPRAELRPRPERRRGSSCSGFWATCAWTSAGPLSAASRRSGTTEPKSTKAPRPRPRVDRSPRTQTVAGLVAGS